MFILINCIYLFNTKFNAVFQAGSAVELDRIDSFVLLDLIGTKNPRFL